MDRLVRRLCDAGLGDKEARAYLALLEIGQGTAYAVAKKAGLKRPTAYLALDALRQRGLALKLPKSKNALFVAKSPAEFFAAEEERLRGAKAALPELLALARAGAGMSQVLYFEGIDGIAEAMRYRMADAAGTDIVAFYGGTTGPLGEKTARLYRDFYTAFADQRTRTRAIAPRDPNVDAFRARDAEQLRDVRVLPKGEYSGPVSHVSVEGGRVKVIFHKDRQALVVENEKFAAFLRELFEIAWARAPRAKPRR